MPPGVEIWGIGDMGMQHDAQKLSLDEEVQMNV